MAGIYLHIPFCKRACHYCDFHFATSKRLQEPLVAALKKELILQRDYLKGAPIRTVYFGGGTPSLLSEESIAALLATIREHYKLEQLEEVTLEANPDDLTLPYATALYEVGINRLSIGVQSFQSELLKKINRVHTAKEATEAIVNAVQAGFSNWSLDLMYGLPGSTRSSWRADLREALALAPPHISAYCLTIEPSTYFGRLQAKGRLSLLSEDSIIQQYEELLQQLEAAGYEQYEISNFALPSYRSQHNSNYWKNIPYLGIGPSAHSYDGHDRHANIKNNRYYITALEEGRLPQVKESLTPKDQVNNYILTNLRTSWGLDCSYVKLKFGYDLWQIKKELLATYFKQELLREEDKRLYLTPSGKLLADAIAQELFKD